jgi:hypothetical protein
VGTGGKKFPQPRLGQRNGVWADDASGIKARRPRGGDQFRLDRGQV